MAYLAVLSSVFLWSHAFFAIKKALGQLNPFELTAFRFIPLTIPCLAFAYWRRPRDTRALVVQDPALLVLSSLLLIPFYNWLLYKGQEQVAPALAALFVGSSPILTYLIAMAVRQETFSWRKAAGIACAFSGLIIAVWPSLGHQRLVGGWFYIVCVFGATLCSALGSVVNHAILKRHSPLSLLSLALPLGCLPLPLTLSPSTLAKIPTLTPATWFAVAFLSLLCSLWGFYAWFYALGKLPPSNVVIFLNLIPIIAMLSGFLFFQEPLTLPLISGAALVIFGVYQTTKN